MLDAVSEWRVCIKRPVGLRVGVDGCVDGGIDVRDDVAKASKQRQIFSTLQPSQPASSSRAEVDRNAQGKATQSVRAPP